jgi:hypothetical protein
MLVVVLRIGPEASNVRKSRDLQCNPMKISSRSGTGLAWLELSLLQFHRLDS